MYCDACRLEKVEGTHLGIQAAPNGATAFHISPYLQYTAMCGSLCLSTRAHFEPAHCVWDGNAGSTEWLSTA